MFYYTRVCSFVYGLLIFSTSSSKYICFYGNNDDTCGVDDKLFMLYTNKKGDSQEILANFLSLRFRFVGS